MGDENAEFAVAIGLREQAAGAERGGYWSAASRFWNTAKDYAEDRRQWTWCLRRAEFCKMASANELENPQTR